MNQDTLQIHWWHCQADCLQQSREALLVPRMLLDDILASWLTEDKICPYIPKYLPNSPKDVRSHMDVRSKRLLGGE